MHTQQKGLSLVELMIGLALGLFISAAGLSPLAGQWREHRSATAAMRLMQELRSAADIIARDLRRAGHWAAPAAGTANPYAAFAPQAAASDAAQFAYSRDSTENQLLDGNEQFGLRLRNGVLELLLGAGHWQALTDAGTLVVTEFSVTPELQSTPLAEHCTTPCPPGEACGPRIEQRSVTIRITARAAGDADLIRRLSSRVQLRNEHVAGACPA
ncbi:prepilin-type N-terminal cleavage/methylation domain-containing protein [Variovorax sp. YR752]|uniref:PilW family protein n=1 Tax=Variovorax sp. YR752 TaxID=1884383 RepID=UPI003137EC7B